jgi:hypothetical protein
MIETKMMYAVWVLYAYTACVLAVYVWDWWVNRKRRREETSEDDGDCPHRGTAAGRDDTTPSAAP